MKTDRLAKSESSEPPRPGTGLLHAREEEDTHAFWDVTRRSALESRGGAAQDTQDKATNVGLHPTCFTILYTDTGPTRSEQCGLVLSRTGLHILAASQSYFARTIARVKTRRSKIYPKPISVWHTQQQELARTIARVKTRRSKIDNKQRKV
jgi:hypothetical protein